MSNYYTLFGIIIQMGQHRFCLFHRKNASAPVMSFHYFVQQISLILIFVLHNTDVNFTHSSERARNKLDEVKLNNDYESMY